MELKEVLNMLKAREVKIIYSAGAVSGLIFSVEEDYIIIDATFRYIIPIDKIQTIIVL